MSNLNGSSIAVPLLHDKHRQEWLNSRVNRDIIERNVRTIEDSRELDRLLNRNTDRRWRHSDHLVPGWAVSGVDPTTGERTLLGAQVKPDNPPPKLDDQGRPQYRADGTPKVQKYLGASGEPTTPLFLETSEPKFWQNVLANPTAPLVIIEGAKKAACVLSTSRTAIAIPGCWNGQNGGKLHPLIRLFCQENRPIILAPDGDWRDNIAVAKGWERLGKLIAKTKAVVSVAIWDEQYKGLDDYAAGGGDIKRVLGDVIPLQEWREDVKLYAQELKAGLPRLSQDRALLVIGNAFGEQLRFNVLTQTPELGSVPLDADIDYLAIGQSLGYQINKDLCNDVVNFLARKRPYNPVLDYLERVHKDVEPTDINSLCTGLLGTSEPLYDVFLKKFLIGAVARAYNPACKLDTALILKGEQGIGKSSFFAVLGGDWFDDSMGELTGKDDAMTAHRSWINEWGEFDRISGKREVETIKAFLSRKTDRFRPPYGRTVREFPRRFVICGSTNQDEFLTDPTGSRRFWVIPVNQIDLERLRLDRDAIWAAAVQAYESGESWWLTQVEQALSEKFNTDYQQSDPWTETIAAKLSQPGAPSQVTTEHVLSDWLNIPTDRQGKLEQRRIGAIMRRLGYERTTQRLGSTPKKCWAKVCSNISNIGNTQTENRSDTEVEPVTDIGNAVTDAGSIGNISVTDDRFIGNTVTDIGNSPKALQGANSTQPVTDVTDKSANIPQEQKYGYATQAIKPGDLVRYGGEVPWIVAMFPDRLAQVVAILPDGGGLEVLQPGRPGEKVGVTLDYWEVVQ